VIHPDQVDLDVTAVRRLLDGSLDVYRCDKRYLHADGHVVWGRLTATIARSGENIYLISQVEDITTIRADERARQRAERLLTIAFDHAPHGTAIIGVQPADRGRLLRVNPALIDMTGRPDLTGSSLGALLDPDPESRTDDVLAEFETLADGDLENLDRVCRLRAGNGHIFVQATITLSRDLDGRPEHALAQLRDVTAQQAHEEWLTRHAKTDELTGLANRLAMRERLEAEIEDLRHGHGPLAVLMLDLDRFKNVNDTLGHEAGDALLRRVAEVLLIELPPDALAARLGGDEFVVIAPRQNTTAAIRLAERIAAAVDAVGAELAGRVIGCVTCSIGLVTTENQATAPQDLIRAADQAMYRNKRNRTDLQAVAVSI
jgi:diguanylate cyclase (GGDEF)-like protein